MIDVCRSDLPQGLRAWLAGGLAAGLLLLQGCATAPAPARAVLTPATPPAAVMEVPDAVPRVEPIKSGGPNKPYTVLGQSYEPVAVDLPWRQQGLASWYGPSFQGHKTASGEIYNMYGMSAAHPTLPIPSYVRVRNLSNGREVIVRVNDRGPFHSKRILDLSYTAAAKLGMLANGTAMVEVQRLTFDDIRTGAWRDASTQVAQQTTPAVTAAAEPERAPEAESLASAPSLAAADPVSSVAQAQPKSADSATATTPKAIAQDSPTPSAAQTIDPEIAFAQLSASPGASASSSPEAAARQADQEAAAAPAAASESPARAYTSVARGFWVQLGAFARSDGAMAIHERAVSELAWLAPLLTVFHEASMFRVQAGPYRSREQAAQVASSVKRVLSLVPVIVERR